MFNVRIHGHDYFNASSLTQRVALLEALEPLDCSAVTNVDRFSISGLQPAGSNRRFLFKINDTLYKFVNGSLTQYTGSTSIDDILDEGNTAADLTALTDITAFVGEQVYPIIALSGTQDAIPTVKLSLVTRTITETLAKRVVSPAYSLKGEDVRLVDATADYTTTGSGIVEVKARIYSDGWSSYQTLDRLANKPATKIQFSVRYSVAALNDGSATLNSITLRHTTAADQNGIRATIFTTTNDFEVPLKTAYAVVRHEKLIDSQIKAYVSFRPKPLHKDFEPLGIASGNRDSFTLPDAQVDWRSLQVFVNGELADADFNLEVNEVTLTAAQGSVVTASYDYNLGTELWHEMTRQAQQPYGDDTYMSRFTFTGNDDDFTQACVKFDLIKTEGIVSNESLGTASGNTQYFVLPHKMNSLTLPRNVSWNYDDSAQILTLVAPAGTALTYSGSWHGEEHQLYSFAAGFAV